jgi:hypothetical protein
MKLPRLHQLQNRLNVKIEPLFLFELLRFSLKNLGWGEGVVIDP